MPDRCMGSTPTGDLSDPRPAAAGGQQIDGPAVTITCLASFREPHTGIMSLISQGSVLAVEGNHQCG